MANVPFELDGVEPLKLIDTGGFGEVWLSRQTNIDRKVAVKVGHAPIDDETIQVRFERECIALGRLSGHPNIVDVFTAGLLNDGRPYLMLEYIDGGTLWQRLNREALSEAAISQIGVELAAALTVAHTVGVLHRDLKPENVLLRSSGEAVLGDFGIARLHDADNTTSEAITASVAYAAPEILLGNPASMATDLYGIGICLLTAATRSVPFLAKEDESVHPIINRVLSDRPPDLTTYDFSPGFSEAMNELLKKKPEDRPLSAEVVHELLAPYAAPVPAASPVTISADHSPDAVAPPDPGRSTSPTRGTGGIPRSARTGSFRSSDSLAVDLTPDDEPSSRRSKRSRNELIRLLGATFGAILLLGGLLVFVLNRYTDLSFSSSSPSADSTVTEGAAPSTTTSTATAPATEAPPEPTPLELPVTLADTDLGPEADIEPDNAGPDSSRFCNATPNTTGLLDWEGQTLGDDVGYPLVFQQLARFESAAAAGTYLNSYLPAPNCRVWTIPATDEDPPIVLEPEIVTPAATHGEENREVVFDGTSGTTSLHVRVAIVRSGSMVYTLSISSLDEADLDGLDDLLALAASRLDL